MYCLPSAVFTSVTGLFAWSVSAAAPLVYGSLAVVLATVALAANFIPALRAARVDPMVVLRNE